MGLTADLSTLFLLSWGSFWRLWSSVPEALRHRHRWRSLGHRLAFAASILAFVFLYYSHTSATLARCFLEKEKGCGSTSSLSRTETDGISTSEQAQTEQKQARTRSPHTSAHSLYPTNPPTPPPRGNLSLIPEGKSQQIRKETTATLSFSFSPSSSSSHSYSPLLQFLCPCSPSHRFTFCVLLTLVCLLTSSFWQYFKDHFPP